MEDIIAPIDKEVLKSELTEEKLPIKVTMKYILLHGKTLLMSLKKLVVFAR